MIVRDATTTQSYTLAVRAAKPQANAGSYTANEGTRIAGNVLRNDFALENDALAAVLISDPIHGTLTLAANGEFVYTPSANYNGTDKFIYKARSASGAESLATEVYLNLNPVNDAPVGTSQSATMLEGTSTVLDLRGAFQDVDGDVLSPRIINEPGIGTLTAIISGSDAGKWLYTPKPKTRAVQRASVDAEMPCAELDGIAVLACKAGRRGVARRPRQLQIGRRTDQAVDVLIEPRRTAEKPLGARHLERCAVR